MEPKYPEIEVQLSGEDGNVFSILGRMQTALRNYGLEELEVRNFMSEAQSGNYDKLLQTCQKWVTIH
jgi:hypothetical protein